MSQSCMQENTRNPVSIEIHLLRACKCEYIYIYMVFCGDVFRDFAFHPSDNGFDYGRLNLVWKKVCQRSAWNRQFSQSFLNREVDRGG